MSNPLFQYYSELDAQIRAEREAAKAEAWERGISVDQLLIEREQERRKAAQQPQPEPPAAPPPPSW